MSGVQDPVIVPTMEALKASVVPRRRVSATPDTPGAPVAPFPPFEPCPEPADLGPSAKAMAVLRFYAYIGNREKPLEACWKAIGVKSGSQKARIVEELQRHGLMRLESKGRRKMVRLYKRAYGLLGIAPPKGDGVGGCIHKVIVAQLADMFRARGYDVHIEGEIGPHRKRIDLVAYGHRRVVGLELGLSRVAQELANLRADLFAGVLDLLLFVATDPSMLNKVRAGAASDPVIAPHIHRIHFCLFSEEEPS